MAKQITTTEEFDKKISNDHNVLIDFFATWCGPCKMQLPILEQVQQELETGGSEKEIYKVDVDQLQDVAARYNVMSIPTLVVFREGQEVTRVTGLQNKEGLLRLLDA